MRSDKRINRKMFPLYETNISCLIYLEMSGNQKEELLIRSWELEGYSQFKLPKHRKFSATVLSSALPDLQGNKGYIISNVP